jgi:hypothetical protein
MEERLEWDEEFEPYEFICDHLGQVPRNLYGNERQEEVRHAVRKTIVWPDVYELISEVGPDQDRRINDALAAAGVAYEFDHGAFHAYEPLANDLQVSEIEESALDIPSEQRKEFAAPLAQYLNALKFLRQMPADTSNAVASAVNALEGTAGVISGKKNVSDGVRKLFPGERRPLGKTMEMLFSYGSTKDGVRHGARTGDDPVSIQEATYIVRAAGSAIVYLIEAHDAGDW